MSYPQGPPPAQQPSYHIPTGVAGGPAPQPQQASFQQQDPQAGPYGQPLGHAAKALAGDKAVQLSIVFGILGLFTVPLLFGPLAIWQANKAYAFGRSATAGRALGWIATLLGLIGLIGIVLFIYVMRTTGTLPFPMPVQPV